MIYYIKWTVLKIGSPFIFLILFNLNSFSQSPDFKITPEIKEAYNNFIELKLRKGERKITTYRKDNPNNGLAILVNNYYDFIHLIISSDKTEYNRLKKNENIRLNKLKKLDKTSPYYLYSIAEIKFQWGFVKLIFDDKISGLWSMRSSYKMIKENQINHPGFSPNQKTLGLMEVILGSVPDENKWILNSIGMKGNFFTGLSYLSTVANSNNIFSTEAKLYKELVNIYILKNETEGIGNLKNLSNQNESNLLIHFLYVSSLAKAGKNDEALKTLNSFKITSEYTIFPSLGYIKGICYLNKLDYENVSKELHSFLKNHKGINYTKSTYYKLYIAHYLNGDTSKLTALRDKGLKVGSKEIDADKDAYGFFHENINPNKELAKARLLFDGGYYNASLILLSNEGDFSENNKIELNYRKARNYHGQRKLKSAIKYYKTCIHLQNLNQKLFYAPNSCLQLGYIYQKIKDNANAKRYFEKAITYKKHQYKNSINNKAKAALQELK